MRVSTLIEYLLGQRRAILDVAACRNVVSLGLVLVISAGFAREYDGEDLLHEPWHVLLPLLASLITSVLLFGLVELIFGKSMGESILASRRISRYGMFVGLYWMTAPLAWLYAIPFERFLGAPDAVRANLWLLAIVSAWRVAIMTRVVSVVYARSAVAAFFVVMLFADSVAMAIVWLTPLPIVSFMGGIRLTESESVIQSVGFLVRFFGAVTWPLWLIGGLLALRSRPRPNEGWQEVLDRNGDCRVSLGLWTGATLAIVVWLAILPFTQDEQINRRRVEKDLRRRRISQAIDFMSRHERGDFPPHWDPPPRLGYGESNPPLLEVLLQLERPGVAPWVRAIFHEKLAVQALADPWDRHWINLAELSEDQLAAYARLLPTWPDGPSLARLHASEIRTILESSAELPLSDRRRAALEAILELAPD